MAVTLFAGISKVSSVKEVSSTVTPSNVQPVNSLPVAGAFAVIVTLLPSAIMPLPVPFSTVKVYVATPPSGMVMLTDGLAL